MKNILFCLVLSFSLALSITAQSYTLNNYEEAYLPLEDYNSIYIELLGDIGWSHRFEFGFEFPFFDQKFDHINAGRTSVFSFDGTNEFDIHLMGFIYELDVILDLDNITSDARYKYFEKNGQRVLVLEQYHARLATDDSVNQYDSHINFQCWFYENGTIQVKIGPYNLTQTENYVPGEGFYLHPGNAGPQLIGPAIGILKPDGLGTGLGFSGSVDDYETVTNIGILKTLPDPGWVIEFKRDLSNTLEDKEAVIAFYPNPTSDYIKVESDNEIQSVEILNIIGRKMLKLKSGFDQINISALQAGNYLIKIETDKGSSTKKLFKI